MSITISSYGTHNVVAPVPEEQINATELSLEVPFDDFLIVKKPAGDSDTGLKPGVEPYYVEWAGDRKSQPLGRVFYRQLKDRSLYRGLEQEILPGQRIPGLSKSQAVSLNSIILLEDQNTATGEILKVPFRASLTLECPWAYLGLDQEVLTKAFGWAVGMLMTNFAHQEAHTPTTSDWANTELLYEKMFSGDLNPRDNNLM